MTITPTRGNGSGTVSYTAEVNTGALRSAQITVAGNSFMVSQLPAGCTYDISYPTDFSFGSEGGTGSVSVEPSFSGCMYPWNAQTNVNWITITPTRGYGSGTVSYTAEVNTGPYRSATITVAGNSFTVSQSSAP
jgi:hypothetical protein